MSALTASDAATTWAGVQERLVKLGNLAVRAILEPVSPYSAAAFRIVFGLLGLTAVVRFAANGWISQLYLEPAYHLSYYGFGWVQPWPAWGMYLHFALLGLASLGVALGYRYRLSIVAFFLLFTYVELIDRTTYLNHYYLVSLLSFIMIFLPLNRVAAFDARGKSADESRPTIPTSIPRGALWLLMAQISLVYVFAGIAKLNPDWLLQAQPLRIWLYNAADVPLAGGLLREEWLAYAFSWGGAVFDLTIVGWLLWRKSRPWAYGVLAAFHGATALLFPALGMFPWIMMGVTLIFFAPDWPLSLLQRVRRWAGLPEASAEVCRPGAAPHRRSDYPTLFPSRRTALVITAAALFLLFQLALPLRHYAYPGNVRWTEEGYLFSWRVMLTEKTGQVVYRVGGLDGAGERLVYPEEYLTPGQVERMAVQPDLILATAHIIRDQFASRGLRQVEVRADAYVSYNGRPAARLIDPAVDLAAVRRGIGPRLWVMPEPRRRE